MALSHLKLGVSPLCWTNDVLDDLGGDIALQTCLQQAAQTGYQGIELGRKFPRDARELHPLLDKVGLQLASGWHSGFLAERSVQEELDAVRPHAQLLQQLGASVMVYGECGLLPGETPLDEQISQSPALASLDLPQYCDKLNAFADVLLRDYGLQLAYHHHLMMVVEHDDELQAFMENTHSNVGLVFDSGHAFAAGVDIARALQRYGSRICHIHLKDVRPEVHQRLYRENLSFNEAVRAGLFTIPGEGGIDYSPIIDFVKRSQYQGWLIIEAEQDPALAPPLPTVQRAFAWANAHFPLTSRETV
ncbi:myo-inosose-2 dehydratase [Enterobacterales bacterium CwR94]|nr:myo-inosose-2 dehydratase [Enterobacterales bacterium CwR94]